MMIIAHQCEILNQLILMLKVDFQQEKVIE